MPARDVAPVASGAARDCLTARAPAKVNLTLHVRGRREDGYHDLESLVAFAGTGDTVSLAPGPDLSLTVTGPTADAAGAAQDNLVLRAARLLAERRPGLRTGRFSLVKRLPVAAGLGGGSSDAAAALRLLARLNGLSLADPAVIEVARATGSDVPVCLTPRARMMSGAGEIVGRPLPALRWFCVLVNPRLPVATPAVFGALGLPRGARAENEPHPACDAGIDLAVLARARNDLEPPALSVEPVIAEVLAVIRRTPGLRLARMSGSGATCFGLYDDCTTAAAAAAAIGRERRDWWVKPTVLR